MDSRTTADVIVVFEAKVEGLMVLLPMTTTGSPSSSSAVRTAEVAVLDADAGTDEVIVLPALSVVTTALWDVGVLDADDSEPVASSEVLVSSMVDDDSAVVSSGVSEVCVADVAVVSSPVIVGPADVSGSSVVSVVLAGSSLVVEDGGAGVVSCEVDSSVVDVGSTVEVGATELLVVTPVPTTCRLFGMTP